MQHTSLPVELELQLELGLELGLEFWWMAVWTVAWSPRTRQHCIHHHPGSCNRWFIGHSFCPTSKGEKGFMKTSRTVYYNNADRRVSLSVAPPTFWNWSETPFQAIPWDQFIPDVLQLVTGAATSLPWFIWRCHLSFGHTVLRSGSPDFASFNADGGQGY